LAELVRQRQDRAADVQRIDGEIVKLAARRGAAPASDDRAALRARLAAARDEIETLNRAIADRFPNYAALADTRPVPAAEVQALLTADEALLVYFTTARETWFWAVRRDRIGLYRSGLGSRELAQRVRTLRAALTPDLPPYPAREAHDLYDEIVAPALPLLEGARRLIVVPDGALQSLPLSILVTAPPTRDPDAHADYPNVAWLARDYAVGVLPAVSSLRALRRPRETAAAGAPFFGIGNPVLGGTPAREGATAPLAVRGGGDDLRALPALPETADELRAIAKALGAGEDDLLLAARATEPVLRQVPLDRYRIIEFATHALLPGDVKGLAEPALVLTPPAQSTPDDNGLLTASKIAGLKLNAEWVVLSACNTATDDEASEAGGWSALAKAFFYAGARSLLVSHWPVWSQATVALTTGAFAELSKDPKIGRAEALRRAELAMLDPKNPPEFAHPLAWAPFVLAGEGGAER